MRCFFCWFSNLLIMLNMRINTMHNQNPLAEFSRRQFTFLRHMFSCSKTKCQILLLPQHRRVHVSGKNARNWEKCNTTCICTHMRSFVFLLPFNDCSSVILTSVSFWPLLMIGTCAPNTCFSCTSCSLSRYNIKCELDCFSCKTGVFLRLFTSMFTKQNNYNPRFCKKINSAMGNIQQLYRKN